MSEITAHMHAGKLELYLTNIHSALTFGSDVIYLEEMEGVKQPLTIGTASTSNAKYHTHIPGGQFCLLAKIQLVTH
jgi:hypothetical protein